MFTEEGDHSQDSGRPEESWCPEKDCNQGYYRFEESHHHQKDHYPKGQSQHCH